MFFHSFIAMENAFTLFLLLIARLMRLDHLASGQFHLKGIKLKTFPQGYAISLCARVRVSTLYSGTGIVPEF